MAKRSDDTAEKLPEASTSAKTALVQASADDFSAYANAGMENVVASDVLVPRLSILQSLSPQLSARKPEDIAGAVMGDICDVGTGEVFKDGISFIPVYYRKEYLEWAPRSSGKGLVQIHSDPSVLDRCQRNEKGQMILPSGNYLAETAQWFGINLTAEGRRSFIPMASTQLKRSRKWMTLATGERLKRSDGSSFIPPLFYRSYDLGVAAESNNEGEWFGWKVDRGPSLPELTSDWKSLRDECVSFREQLLSGSLRGDLASDESTTTPSSDDGAM